MSNPTSSDKVRHLLEENDLFFRERAAKYNNLAIPKYQMPSTDSIPDLMIQWERVKEIKDDVDLETKEWKELEGSYRAHLGWRFAYPKKIFDQQIITSWVITFLVISLVISGIVFSGIQLNNAIKYGDLASLETELAVEIAGKVTITSSLIGAVVLIISLAFFYLYIRYVYGVRNPEPPHVSFVDTDVLRMRDAGQAPEENS